MYLYYLKLFQTYTQISFYISLAKGLSLRTDRSDLSSKSICSNLFS